MSARNRVAPAMALVVLTGGGWVGVSRILTRYGHATAMSPAQRRSADGLLLHVPHMAGGILLDGDTDDPGWTGLPGPARTGPFLGANGAPARPYSDARLVWGDGQLYATLYAADEDIRSPVNEPDGPLWLADSFRLLFTRDEVEYSIEVSPSGAITDAIRKPGGAFDYTWNSGAHVSHEEDGTVNDPADSDEEWVIEMALPVASLGMRGESGERIGFAARRCDTPKSAPRVCASWRGELVID